MTLAPPPARPRPDGPQPAGAPTAPLPLAPDQAKPGGRRRRRRDPADRPPHLYLAELFLFALTAAAVYGFTRIFETGDFLVPLLAIAAATHLTAVLLRRRGTGLVLSFLGVAVVWVLATTWAFLRDTTWVVLPTSTTLDVARSDVEQAWSAFHELVAPAPELNGFLLVAALAVGVTVFLADWAAFRMWSSREAVVPSLTLFIFATMLARDEGRVVCAIAWFSAAVAFVLAHRVARLERSTGWVSTQRAAGGRALLRVGLLLALAAVLLGVVVGPRLPGSQDAAIFDWRGEGRTSGRVTVSPLVDIKSRLVQRTEVQVFQVRSPRPSYWRMTALDDFDGNIWRSSGDYESAAASMGGGITGPMWAEGDRITQEFTIQRLATVWLPAAYAAIDLAPGQVSAAFQQETRTLIVDDADEAPEGTSYTVLSLFGSYDGEELRSADPAVPDDMDDMLDLPPAFPELAEDLAAEVTEGAETPYDKAFALQNWFRDGGGFVYDLEVDTGHSDDAIEQFLEERRGYCEQFAGTFAAMARSLGLPARVAVGFTPGEIVEGTEDVYQVRGRNAHAWPEVYLGDYGWVAFEPTPGRGAPGAQAYTGVAPDQQTADEELPAAEATTTTTLPDSTESSDSVDDPFLQDLEEMTAGGATSGQAATVDDGSGSSIVVVVLALAALAYLAVVPGRRHLRWRQRRSRAEGDPRAEVGVAWAETAEVLSAAGLPPRADETHTAVAERVGRVLPEQSAALERLAAAADLASYAPDDVAPGLARRAGTDAHLVAEAIRDRLPWWRRLGLWLDPRTARAPHQAPRHLVDRPHG
jgi:transglutaminase-like putative cysteine protease